jgi:hypothetical protein
MLARVGVQWVPPEWKSWKMMLPGCLAQASMCGVRAVPRVRPHCRFRNRVPEENLC